MAYTEDEARLLVVRAGRRLLEAGLAARTWGNVSARVSDTHFVITPSGEAYEDLRPERLVRVRIADGSYTGKVRPSSERGIHADAYRLRPDVNFVIHTHQYEASVAGVAGRDLSGLSHPLLGERVPCAAYGLPGTARLRRAVAAQLADWPSSPALLMRRHGALCLGGTMEDAFSAAQALEEVCAAHVRSLAGRAAECAVPDCGRSQRRGDAFLLTVGCRQQAFWLGGRNLPPAAALHAAVYRSTDAQYIAHETDPSVVAASARGRTLRPLLDDLAQIAGPDIRCAVPEPEPAARALGDRRAVLLWSLGALCLGSSEDDLEAVRLLLRKGCAARRFADAVPGCRPLGRLDALVQRMVYVGQYAGRRETFRYIDS